MGAPSGWIAFSDRMPEPAYDRKNPGPTHGMILVTNAIDARDRWGRMSHVWIVNMVHAHPNGPHIFNGRELAVQGEITAFAHPGDMSLRGLTHWRPAVLEEWTDTARPSVDVAVSDEAGGWNPFIVAVHGAFTLDDLAEIERAAAEDEFKSGGGTYRIYPDLFGGQPGEEGRWEIEPGWGFDPLDAVYLGPSCSPKGDGDE